MQHTAATSAATNDSAFDLAFRTLEQHGVAAGAYIHLCSDSDEVSVYSGHPDEVSASGTYAIPGPGLTGEQAWAYVAGAQSAIASLISRWEATLEPGASPTWLVTAYALDGSVYRQWRIVAGGAPGLPVLVVP